MGFPCRTVRTAVRRTRGGRAASAQNGLPGSRGRASYMPTRIDVFAKARDFERAALLQAVQEADALPYFRQLTGPAGPVVEMEGAERVMLGSNNYLGLTGDARVKQGALDALERYGTGLTGSRLLNGTIPLHLELERELADWMGTEAALVFTTGHQANVGTLGTILAPGDTVVADSADHASILDGCLLSRAKLRPFRHNRLDKLAKQLERAAADPGRPPAPPGQASPLPAKTASTSSPSSSSGPRRTAAGSWWSSTGSSPWRATSRRCRRSASSPSATAPA